MPLTVDDAALILGTTAEQIKDLQRRKLMPDPIPDDYLDPSVNFRIELNKALQRKIDRARHVES